MTDLEPIEPLLRAAERLNPAADLVVRGWPLTVEGLMRNAEATRSRFALAGVPFAAISAEVTIEGWTLDCILAGPVCGHVADTQPFRPACCSVRASSSCQHSPPRTPH